MASLGTATIASSYKSLLKLSGNTDDLAAATSTAKQVTTGDGDATVIYLNTDRVGIGTSAPGKIFEIKDTAAQLRLKNGSNSVDFLASSDGDLTITPTASRSLYIPSSLILTRASVVNMTNGASIPITSACVNIDANGLARTGIVFAGTGTAGQIIVVNNTGGETLTFDNTPGTCLVRGMTASLDTMEPLGVYMFVSDGALWNLIGGGSLPNEGLTAS